jgi:hypothetical protein
MTEPDEKKPVEGRPVFASELLGRKRIFFEEGLYLDHDLLIRIDERVRLMSDELKNQNAQTVKDVACLRTDIDGIKAWRQNLMGKIAVISAAGSATITIILDFILRKFI